MVLQTGVGVPVDAAELVERLGVVREELSMLARAPFGSFSETEAGRVVAGVEGVTRLSEALTTACAGGVDQGQAWTAGGFSSFAQWWTLHSHRRRSTSTAVRLLARDLRERLPLTAAALAQGRLGAEHARVLARFTKTEAQREQLLDEEMGEEFLVAQGQRLPVESFARVVRSWATRTDPEAADRGWREQGAKRELYVAPVLDGTDVRGWLGLEEGQVVSEALTAIIGTPAAEDERTPAQRRADALVHLCRLFLDGGLAQPGSRIRPHIAISIDFATLERLINATGPQVTMGELFGQLVATGRPPHPTGDVEDGDADNHGTDHLHAASDADQAAAADHDTDPDADTDTDDDAGGGAVFGPPGADRGAEGAQEEARTGQTGCCGGVIIPAALDVEILGGVAPGTFADGSPIPYGQLVKLLCAGEFHRVVFGPEGQILDSGRTERLFTPAQTRAIIARDQHCQYPGCDAPPRQGEIHHCLWWYHQGRTSTDNGVLLCWWHHTLVHQQHLTITRHHHHDRAWWQFTTTDGQPLRQITPPAHTYTAPDPLPPVPHQRE